MSKLTGTRIAVVTPPAKSVAGAALLTKVLVGAWARLWHWPNIDFVGEIAASLFGVGHDAASMAGTAAVAGLELSWAPPYDIVVRVGGPTHAIEGSGLHRLGDWSADVRELFGALDLHLRDLRFQDPHIFGVGAVTHALAWMIQNWPEPISGELHFVNGDAYVDGNGL